MDRRFWGDYIPRYLENTSARVTLRCAYMGATFNGQGFWAECVGLKIFCKWSEANFKKFAYVLDERDLIEVKGVFVGSKGCVNVIVKTMKKL